MTPDALAHLHGRAFDHGWSAAEFERLLAQDTVALFAEAQGFVLIQSVLDEAEILTLATDPDHRGRGMARRVLQEAIHTLESRGIRRLFLEVAEDNGAARALYAAQGFVETGRRKGYYMRRNARVDALLLTRPLVAASDTPPEPKSG